MRRLVDVLIVLSAGMLVSLIAYVNVADSREEMAVRQLAEEVRRFQQMIDLQAASAGAELNARGWPITVDPAWFGNEPPRNRLLPGHRAWVDVALPEQAELRDPPVRMALTTQEAGFWYNPSQGIVRARVPMGTSDAEALRVYNIVNGTKLTSIYASPAERSLPAGMKPPESISHPRVEPPPPPAEEPVPALEVPRITGIEAGLEPGSTPR